MTTPEQVAESLGLGSYCPCWRVTTFDGTHEDYCPISRVAFALRAYGAAERERAAKLCDGYAAKGTEVWLYDDDHRAESAAAALAAAIRSLTD